MTIEELKQGILESRQTLETYRWFGNQVQEALDALDEIEKYIDNPKPEERQRIFRILEEMKHRLSSYKRFVPVLIETIKNIENWFKEKP